MDGEMNTWEHLCGSDGVTTEMFSDYFIFHYDVSVRCSQIAVISQGCHGEAGQIERLNTDIYSLTILEATSLRPRCQAGWFLLEPLSWVGEGLPSHCIPAHSFPLCLSVSWSPLLIRTLKVILAYNPNHVTTFYFNYLLKVLSPNKPHSEVLRARTLKYKFREDTVKPIQGIFTNCN